MMDSPRALPEILAPAGTEESFQAALASRADAVYLGLAEGFNARGRSTAFSLESLPNLVRRAHWAGVKLYLTLNTLIFERELEILEGIVNAVIRSGVDALIIQDPGAALLARRVSGHIRLHASTQMTISSVEGARFAETLGICRVVLPRELSAREVALFTRQSPMECEVFVHGALCMAWSGQCLTSETFSERSANRGQCSQACRMPYDAIVDGEKMDLGDRRYLLSPQDLSAHEVLPELIAAGVCSLKIEGRYKGPAYVATAVDSWRSFRDAAVRGVDDAERSELKRIRDQTQLTFSRGASSGFLQGDNHQTLVVGTTPKHRGLDLGEVLSVFKHTVQIALPRGSDVAQYLRPGVGIKFELARRPLNNPEDAPGGPLFGLRQIDERRFELSFGRPGPDLSQVRSGDAVRLTGDPEIARNVERRLSQALEGRHPLAFTIRGREGAPLEVEATATFADRRVAGTARSSSVLTVARSGTGLTETLLREKLFALGGTPFFAESLVSADLEPQLALPVSELKGLRRELASQLESALFEAPSPKVTSSPTKLPALQAELIRTLTPLDVPAQVVPLCRTLEQLEAVIASRPDADSEVELDWMEMVGLTTAVRLARSSGLKVTLATVRVQKPGEEAYDRRIQTLQPDGVLARHWGALMHFSEARDPHASADSGLAVHGDFSLNVTNSLTANHLLRLGLSTVTASHDLNQAQLLDLLEATPRGRIAVTLHHHIATFHNSHCVYAHLLSQGTDYKTCGRPCEKHRLSLRDYAGHEHPVVVDVSCRNTVFNALAQSAAPLVPRLLELGVRRFRVEFVWEKAEEVTRTLAAYRGLIRGEVSAKEALERARVHERYGVTTPLRSRK